MAYTWLHRVVKQTVIYGIHLASQGCQTTVIYGIHLASQGCQTDSYLWHTPGFTGLSNRQLSMAYTWLHRVVKQTVIYGIHLASWGCQTVRQIVVYDIHLASQGCQTDSCLWYTPGFTGLSNRQLSMAYTWLHRVVKL